MIMIMNEPCMICVYEYPLYASTEYWLQTHKIRQHGKIELAIQRNKTKKSVDCDSFENASIEKKNPKS